MVKLFIGNLPREATEQEIRTLFEQYGKVLECDIIKNYGFVHIEDKTAAEDAIRNLHHYKLHGVNINVEASKNKSKTSTKLHVGNISPTCTNKELRAKFEEYGPVIECDIVKDYAFVHMERAEDAVEAIRGLDNTEFQALGFSFRLKIRVHGQAFKALCDLPPPLSSTNLFYSPLLAKLQPYYTGRTFCRSIEDTPGLSSLSICTS
uniref:RRM domain-containing protein n=1 Tax=Myotis myotis TaxID=51298 RepID=A0A7J7VIF3_MYOMY|nr:hypothetical protein mMyoMyo1_008384 [Myotis myotis]